MDKNNCNKLAKAVTKAGIILMESGAETYRVEETMERICLAYGASVVDSYATPTMLLISFSLDDELYHNIKRIKKIKGVDLTKIDKVNSLSRYVSNNALELDEFVNILNEIDKEPKYSFKMNLFAAFICTMGFVFFFKGNINDMIVACAIGVLVKFLSVILDKIEFSPFFSNVFLSMLITVCSIMSEYIHFADKNIVNISVIMLLVPGLAITNAIRDTVNGDLISGLTRTTEAIFVAIALALGSGLAVIIMGGVLGV